MDLRERIDRLYAAHPKGEASGYRAPPPHAARPIAWVAEQTGASWRSVYDWCAGKYPPPTMFLRAVERLEAEAE
jgi:hypothetical protein